MGISFSLPFLLLLCPFFLVFSPSSLLLLNLGGNFDPIISCLRLSIFRLGWAHAREIHQRGKEILQVIILPNRNWLRYSRPLVVQRLFRYFSSSFPLSRRGEFDGGVLVCLYESSGWVGVDRRNVEGMESVKIKETHLTARVVADTPQLPPPPPPPLLGKFKSIGNLATWGDERATSAEQEAQPS